MFDILDDVSTLIEYILEIGARNIVEQIACEINEFESAMRHFAMSGTDKCRCSNIYVSDVDRKRLIDGNYANNKRVVARCYSPTHRGYLTKSLMKSHKCLEKKCNSFKKINDEYWKAVEKAESIEKRKRAEAKKRKKQADVRDTIIRETLEKSGHIHITSICEEKDNLLSISYIYDRKVNLSHELKQLRNKLGYKINMHPKIGSSEAIETLIRKPRRETCEVTDLCNAPKVGPVTKKRLFTMGVYCIEDLFGRSGDELYRLDCHISGEKVHRRYLDAYRSAVQCSFSLP